MTIYTRTGDDGDTALFGGGRVPKNNGRVEAYGAVDELNSFVGLALTSLADADVRRGLLLIQNDLFFARRQPRYPGRGRFAAPAQDARRSLSQGGGDGALDRPGHRGAPRAASVRTSRWYRGGGNAPRMPIGVPAGGTRPWLHWVERSLWTMGSSPISTDYPIYFLFGLVSKTTGRGIRTCPWSKE